MPAQDSAELADLIAAALRQQQWGGHLTEVTHAQHPIWGGFVTVTSSTPEKVTTFEVRIMTKKVVT